MTLVPWTPVLRGSQSGRLGGYRKGAGGSVDWFLFYNRCRWKRAFEAGGAQVVRWETGRPGVPPLQQGLRPDSISGYGRPRGPPLQPLEPDGRVRTPAPTANIEAVPSFVGAGHWPARRLRTSKHLLGKARRGIGTAPALIFCHVRPQWAGKKRGPPLRFCAPEIYFYLSGTRPP